MEKNSSTYKLVVLILVIVGLALLFLIIKENDEGTEGVLENDSEFQTEIVPGENEEGDTENDLGQNTGDTIVIFDQEAGDKVIISDMFLTESRWIVIHEDLDGDLGNILGATLFFEGNTGGEVSLLRGTKAGGKYYAVLYMLAERESDRNRQFDKARDLPLVKEGGDLKKVIFSTF